MGVLGSDDLDSVATIGKRAVAELWERTLRFRGTILRNADPEPASNTRASSQLVFASL